MTLSLSLSVLGFYLSAVPLFVVCIYLSQSQLLFCSGHLFYLHFVLWRSVSIRAHDFFYSSTYTDIVSDSPKIFLMNKLIYVA